MCSNIFGNWPFAFCIYQQCRFLTQINDKPKTSFFKLSEIKPIFVYMEVCTLFNAFLGFYFWLCSPFIFHFFLFNLTSDCQTSLHAWSVSVLPQIFDFQYNNSNALGLSNVLKYYMILFLSMDLNTKGCISSEYGKIWLKI